MRRIGGLFPAWVAIGTLLTCLVAYTQENTTDETAVDEIPADEPAADTTAIEPATETDPIGVDKSNPNWKQQLTAPAIMNFDPETTWYWDLETNMGTMSLRLFHEAAPMHVTSTIYLTELGFYDDVIFHRVITGFMAQGGDPTGTGRGGPGYQYDGEFSSGMSHDRPGLLSMANAGRGTDGSQFFITFVPTPHLDGNHTIFGELVSGQETLDALEQRGSRNGTTNGKLQIIKAMIRREIH